LQGFNRGQIAPKCVFPTDYALKPEKGCWLSGGKVNNYLVSAYDIEGKGGALSIYAAGNYAYLTDSWCGLLTPI